MGRSSENLGRFAGREAKFPSLLEFLDLCSVVVSLARSV